MSYVPLAASHCKSERSVLALKMGPFRWIKYSPIYFWVLFGSLYQGQSNYPGMTWIQGLKWVPAWAGIAFWWGSFALNCAQIASEGAESEFGLQSWIGTLELKQIFLIFSAP